MEDMTPGTLDARMFLFELFDIQSSVDYFIEYGNERTDIFHLSLYEFPAVNDITVVYGLIGRTVRPRASGQLECRFYNPIEIDGAVNLRNDVILRILKAERFKF